MRLLVTGLKGQVVSALVACAQDHSDLEVNTLGRPELDLGDDRDLYALLRSHDPDVIVNAAAYTAVDQAEQEPELASRINGQGAGHVAGAARRLGLPVVHLSTDYVFDGTKPDPYVETDPVRPVGAYGRSKLLGEQFVASANPEHVILRTAWVYAPRGKNFVRTMLRLAATREEVSVVGDQQGCPTYAPDIAAAVVTIARQLVAAPRKPDHCGIFNMAGRGSTDWAGFAEAIFAESARRGGPSARVRRITSAEYPTPAMRPANSRLDCARLAEVFGITMPTWQNALSRCMDQLAKDGELHA